MTIVRDLPPSASQEATAPRLLAGSSDARQRLTWQGHVSVHGHLPTMVTRGDVDLLDWADAVNLRGRGGAHFPFARKARAVRAAGGGAVVVGNGSEGEPASRKDAELLLRAPHLVLDGLQLAAAAVGAGDLRLVVGDATARASVEAAVDERREAGLAERRVELRKAPGRFVAGESSAVVRIAARGAARPAFTTRPAAAGGVDGRPTLVSNVETLAQLALLGRIGVAGYSSSGTVDEPGTTLLTVHRPGEEPEVLEVPFGTPVTDLFGAAPFQALLSGGYHGAWLSGDAAMRAVVTRASLAEVGGSLGAGVLLALPVSCCALVESAPMVELMATQVAGQCGPCVNGLPAIAAVLSALAAGVAGRGELERLERWCGMVMGRGACAHPDGVVRFVRSLLTVFADEVDGHLLGGCGRPCRGLLPLGELAR
jgi:NADH:ubiquinone oxidoreductase subunit F (NADH-binding)